MQDENRRLKAAIILKIKEKVQHELNKYPKFWDLTQLQINLTKCIANPFYNKPKLVPLDSNTHPANIVITDFYRTCPKKEVIKVEAMQNQYLWNGYLSARQNMIYLMGEENLNEKTLWHGTNTVDAMKSIQIEGFRHEFNENGNFGRGTYFASNAQGAIGYSCKENGISKIFACRAITGNSCIGNNNYDFGSWPRTENGKGREYDSLVDNLINPSIFVIQEDHNVYPMYVIHFN